MWSSVAASVWAFFRRSGQLIGACQQRLRDSPRGSLAAGRSRSAHRCLARGGACHDNCGISDNLLLSHSFPAMALSQISDKAGPAVSAVCATLGRKASFGAVGEAVLDCL
jgi:hypothetical protein